MNSVSHFLPFLDLSFRVEGSFDANNMAIFFRARACEEDHVKIGERGGNHKPSFHQLIYLAIYMRICAKIEPPRFI